MHAPTSFVVTCSIHQVNLPVFATWGCLYRLALEGIEAQQRVNDLGAGQNLHLAHLLRIPNIFWRKKFQDDETRAQMFLIKNPV